MAESSWPTLAGSRVVTDIQWEQMASGFAADGVVGSPTDSAVVYADSTGMQVKIRASKLALVRGHGWYSGASEFTKAIGSNSSGSTRVDRIVLRLTRSTWAVTSEVKAGTPGAGAPALTQDATGSGSGVYEIGLATVTVTNGAATISAGNVAPEARYIGGSAISARPKLYQHIPPTALSASFTNTAGPTADLVNSTGMFPYAGARLTLDKQSPDSSLEVDIKATGTVNTPGRVMCGVRVMASGYTSTNFNAGTMYFNRPVYVGVDYSAWLTTHTGQLQGGTPHGHNIGQHNHGVTLPAMHHVVQGAVHITGLAVRTYTLQPFFYVASGQTFTMDSNDQLIFRVAEV